MELNTPVANLTGVGPKTDNALQKAGIYLLEDLLEYYPFRYIDATKISNISNLGVDREALIRAKIEEITVEKTPRKRIPILKASVSDASGSIGIVWFHQVYLSSFLKVGQTYYFFGKKTFDWSSKKTVLQSPLILFNLQIIPIYHQTGNLKSSQIKKIVSNSLINLTGVEEFLPAEILEKYQLIGFYKALCFIHKPESMDQISLARKRLEFNELLLLSIKIYLSQPQNLIAYKIATPIDEIKKFVGSLPFTLTDSQRKTAWQILKDLDSAKPMQRLMMGDVGSGKTIVGLIAVISAVRINLQALWLAPTEILANQHFQTASKMFEKLGISVGLYTGANKKADLSNDDLIIGTHALIQPKIKFRKIGLLIVDEQHRFGVAQRGELTKIYKTTPHFLSMTATPIPRTLALALYSNLRISVIDELPSNRKKIITKLVLEQDREKVYTFLAKHLQAGEQIFIVTPLIEEGNSENLFGNNKKNVTNEFEAIKKRFPKYRVGYLHGRLKTKDKNEVMQQFRNKQYHILVSTTVIEVGIDISNASIIIIEDADSFGLATLHQLRGRVGRGEKQSYCFLFSNSNDEKTLNRLEYLEKYHNGQKLAQADLALRGPGSLVGLKQSGFVDLKIASLTDTLTLAYVKEALAWLIKKGIPKRLLEKINQENLRHHLE